MRRKSVKSAPMAGRPPKRSDLAHVKKAEESKAATSKQAAMLKEFREASSLTREALAKRLGVGVTAVYAWERAEYEPSAAIYSKLVTSSTGVEWKYTKHFLSRLGFDDRTLQQIADRARDVPPMFVTIPYLRNEAEEILYPRSLLRDCESTRIVRVRGSDETYFGAGDVLLIDTSQIALWKMDEGSFVAVH